MARQKDQLGVAESTPNKIIRRLSERRPDGHFAHALKSGHLVKPAAADHPDNRIRHKLGNRTCDKGRTPCQGIDAFALELPARRLNIVAARPAHIDLHSGVAQGHLKTPDLLIRRSRILAARMRIERYDVHLARNAAQEHRQLARVTLGVVDAAQQYVFERDALTPW